MMAGALNFTPSLIHRPILRAKTNPPISRRSFSIRSSSTETPVTSKDEPPKTTTFSAPPNFKPPEPKAFSVRPDKVFDIVGASLALFFRLGTGVWVSGYSASIVSKDEIPSDQYALGLAGYKVKETSKPGPRPELPIEIYEFEGCPFCRKVREIVAVLDLDVLYYPCPQNGPNFRPKAIQMGGKRQFPYMVDPNTGVAMYESDDIIKYLVEKYGDGKVPLMLSLGLLTTLTAGFAMIGRMGKGSIYTPSKLPPKPLELWAYEPSPFCKVVREVLVELELPHILHSCARGSPKRQLIYEKTGHFQVPYLEDPNTGIQMFESAEIVEYIKATYAL
ncbi:Thioredoxin family protein [Heracleum sosnowskyi]|uniref:Thioredoxin family protein n=1 Tax=Heracleum sosnowskyi TaxID=360622 RepID=A0AAD8IRF6_9APIA|nr:Thioredoxin family protein [Heracleum sosnowskyi]